MTTNHDITIFNKRLHREERRDTFFATNVYGVSFYDVRGSSVSNGDQQERLTFKIRIPADARTEGGRTYIDAARYTALTDEEAKNFWTIQHGDCILPGTIAVAGKWIWDEFSFRTGVIVKEVISDAQSLQKFNGDYVTVVEYADNTTRGSRAVKHWRIGGA